MKKPILKVTNLTKDFGSNKGAFDVSFEIFPGQIIGFIGPNGAGKTTTLSMISGFLWPNFGNTQILGKEIDPSNIHTVMPDIGIMISENSFELDLKVSDILNRNRILKNLPNNSNQIQELASLFELDLTKTYRSLSFGNRKKVSLVNALLGQNKLLVLDEPTAGLDPVIQNKFLNLLRQLQKKGTAIILSSHVLSEIQSVSDRILIIKDGTIVLQQNTSQVLQKAFKVFRISRCSSKLKKEILDKKLATKVQEIGTDSLFFTTTRLPLTSFLLANKIEDFYIEKPNLEEMFLEMFE
jgi:ABC-2 type transport system ATP-binding protein